MKTYIQILQLHAKVKNLCYPDNLIKKEVAIPTALWNSSTDSSGNFWACLLCQEFNGELGYEDSTVHYQLYFFISSMAHFYREPIGKQIERKHYLVNGVINNMFLPNKVKEQLRDIFEKTQRTYMAMTKLANLVRHKIKKEKIDFDLRMEPIDIRSKYAISIVHNDALYFFALTDLVNIITTAITHSQDLFEDPLFPKNPYNNLPFTKVHLYNIYFRIKFVFVNVPEWIQLFYNSVFNLDVFKIENEQKLREQYIKSHVKEGSILVLYHEFQSMISHYKRIFRNIQISEDFPKKDLVDIFRPYLYLYIMSMDAIEGTEKKRLAEIILRKKLQSFVSYNENFGRKIVKTSMVTIAVLPPDLSHNTGMFDFSMNQREIRRKYVTNTTYNRDHLAFTLKEACECFDKKKIFTVTPMRSPIHHSREERDRTSSSDVDSDEVSVRGVGSYPIPSNQELDTSYQGSMTYDEIENDFLNILNHLGGLTESDTDSVS